MNMKKKGGKIAPSAEGGSSEYFEGGSKPVNDSEMGDDQVQMLELVEEELEEINEDSVEKIPKEEDQPAEETLSPEQIATERPADDIG